MSGSLAALAARAVGRRVRLKTGQEGTVTRVTAWGYVVSVPCQTGKDLTFLDD